jgi:hypothetical protein
MSHYRFAAVLLLAPACIPPMYKPQPVDPAAQRAAMAQSMGYPTKKSPEELEQAIAKNTDKFKPTGRKGETHLEAPEPFVFDGKNGTCYTVVMRLGENAAWGLGAEAGLKFDFKRPEIAGSGGPGVIGPGAVASVGCAEADGPITLTMAPMIGADPIGSGPLSMQLFSHVLTRAEREHLEADKQRQIAEQREFAAREREREAQERERRDRESAERASRPSSSGSSGGGSSGGGSSAPSGPVSVTIRSSCPKTVPVFYGNKPKYGSGTSSSVSTNSVSSHSFREGDMFWVTDESGNGLDGFTVTRGTRTIEIDSSCTRLSGR